MNTSADKLTICNMALGFLGTRTIASLEEKTPEAVQCKLYFDRARRGALRDYPYRFATRRVQLAGKEMPEVYAEDWRYAYGVPDGCLKVQRVHGARDRGEEKPFLLENSGEEILLFCNVEQAQATCTFDIEDVAMWDDLFVMCMARYLACLLAVPLLKNNSSKVAELHQLYQAALPSAQGQDASEGRRRKDIDPWLLARGSYWGIE